MESIKKVMIIGGGGREQALAQKLAGECEEVIVSPGNPGNEDFAISTGADPTDIESQLKVAKRHRVDLTVVGSDDPLELGIVDAFKERGRNIFGPTKEQARIEWDRGFARQLAGQSGIPMGPYAQFTSKSEAKRYAKADGRAWPLYVKDNGLRQGKGVTKARTYKKFKRAIADLENFVIEDYVPGLDLSHHAFCDGKTHLSFPGLVRDHKPVGDNDTGLMSGGMGTVGPLPGYTAEEVFELGETFVSPVVKGLGFKGLLFSGLKGAKGNERSLEWNARPGDPEMQVFMRLMKSELLPILMACAEGGLDKLEMPELYLGQSAVCLALAAPGYPDKPQKKMLIEGIEHAAEVDGVRILHAGTKRKGEKLYTKGGRILNIVVGATSLELAIKHAYEAAELITFDGQPPLMRTDIGTTTLAEA